MPTISSSLPQFVLLSISVVLFASPLCSEESTEPVAAAPSAVELLQQLPDPNPDMRNGLAINNYNAGVYQELFIPELRSRFRTGTLHVTVFSGLPFEPSLGAGYADEPLEPEIDEDGSLRKALNIVQGPLYKVDSAQDPRTQIAKLLWNTHSTWWSARFLEAQFSLMFVRNDTIFRTYSGTYQRIYPRSLNAEDKTDQLFRARLDFTAPDVINTFSWLRFRFQGKDDDVVFMYSPITKKTRQLTVSNTSDPLLGSSLTLDDFFSWSGKVDGVDGISNETKTFLVPFVPVQFGVASYGSSDSCERYTIENPQLLWNYDTKLYPPGAVWLPTAAAYVPRVLQRVTINPGDPYSAYGRQILYIDAVLGVPVYKIVYDASGSLWKIIISVYGVDADHNRGRALTPLQQIILDDKVNQVSLLQFNTVKTCSNVDVPSVIGRFSPAALLPQVPESNAPAEPELPKTGNPGQ